MLVTRLSTPAFGLVLIAIGGFPLLADSFEERGGRLVVGVLGNEISLKGALKDGLAKAAGAARQQIEDCRELTFGR